MVDIYKIQIMHNPSKEKYEILATEMNDNNITYPIYDLGENACYVPKSDVNEKGLDCFITCLKEKMVQKKLDIILGHQQDIQKLISTSTYNNIRE